jgi:hypothetical protein
MGAALPGPINPTQAPPRAHVNQSHRSQPDSAQIGTIRILSDGKRTPSVNPRS